MKTLRLITLTCAFVVGPIVVSAQDNMKLSYDRPAVEWTEALPVGNGSLGAMVFGGVEKEHLQFNEETLWAGKPHNYAHKGAAEHLAEIRSLLSEGKQIEAQNLATEEFMSVPLRQVPYQPFGDLYLGFPDHKNYTAYHRELDLSNAVSTVSYQVDGVNYKREVFSSYPDQILAVHVTADKSRALGFEVWMDALHEKKEVVTSASSQTLKVKVKDGALRGVASFKVQTDGEITTSKGRLKISNASWADIYLSAATNYVDFNDVSGEPEKEVEAILGKVDGVGFKAVKERHISDYRSLYDRFKIDLGDNGRSTTTTDRRIYDFWKDPNDPQLVALYVQYARYLLIASSRPGTKPATLQGIWNPKLNPPWFSSYTTNINVEMNYWPAEVANLGECHEPLFSLVEDLSQTGKSVAREHYNADGWIAHHNVDIWRGAAPVNASNHGIWLGGGAWLSSHIWEHYLFTLDKEFLKEYFPIIKESALFYSQFLYEDPKTGYLISSPSNSPEIGGLVAGPTMDHQLIRALFRSVIEASAILGKDQAFAEGLKEMLPKIAPNKIGKHGQLQEWMEDKDDPDNHHRHVSHLWAVHPGNEINWEDTPELMKAARQSLEYRGDNGTGWSLAWKINFWSRFKDGNRAYSLMHRLLSPAEEPSRKIRGGSYPNLFDAHPPFQIDGNFGGAAGILEMLVQSHLGKIELLPALPDALPKGQVAGLMARGGFEISMAWKDSRLESVEVLSKKGADCTLQYKGKVVEFKTVAGKKYKFNGELK
ncbi:glycoside hydrolase family 95 protein [Pseudozobellia thermophila]|uniref:Alpha-L-fucosidase 2 n=1 Tax=Pseudozobellia thermophila TaxID=192903 RepID=A0A1M6DB97_9FLAO|nr:glycoside hydrolase family 95 protein [Pseudozobellia thermophila]SHI70410.1 alpha-L-fucosidase 2 [Pseudozobellia thermophila]